jgi:hypothetical protein
MNFSVLPSLVALAILLVIFAALLRQGSTERLDLWLAGWIFVLEPISPTSLLNKQLLLKRN